MTADQRYEVKVEHIFEGPMDLLIFLIKKNEVDIYDIPIALITDQYLAYIDWMKAMNIDFAGDFLFMAATLIQIKSKMLLPVHEELEDDEDPRMEIARPLLEYLRMKSAAEQLDGRPLLGEDSFVHPPGKDELTVDPSEQDIQVDLFELINAFQQVLQRLPAEHQVDFSADRFSIKDKISEIIDILEERETATFYELFAESADKEELIVTFLAILEMAKLNLIRVAQHGHTGMIRLFYL